ncbi:MAG: hypothetical protein M0Q92_06065 [Methanoregula sp.]|nr:hypothetical protein [Methanoregula sp.]
MREAWVVAALLVCGTVLNNGYPLFAETLSILVGIVFLIVAYGLMVMVVPLRMAEVVGIRILSEARQCPACMEGAV